MLILSRKEDEAIRIGDDVIVMVTSIRGRRVRLGITAPEATPIYRVELDGKIIDGKKLPQEPTP